MSTALARLRPGGANRKQRRRNAKLDRIAVRKARKELKASALAKKRKEAEGEQDKTHDPIH
jgi:hypothetical protein